MTDKKARIALAVLLVLFLVLAFRTFRIGKRVKILDEKVRSLSGQSANTQKTPPADPKAALRGQMAEQRARLLQVNNALHKEDREKYGEEIDGLYQQARARDRGGANPADHVKSEQALSKMMDQYPDANATGMLMAERALEFAMRMKTSDVEYYFNILSKNPKFQQTVTDMGVEAYPSLLIFLTRQYIRNGQKDKAEAYIQRLEENYGEKLLADKGRGGQSEWKLGSEIAAMLRRGLTGVHEGPGMGPLPK